LHVGPFTDSAGNTLEDNLIETLDKSNVGKVMARLRRGRGERTDNVRIKLFEVLAAVGGAKALARLNDTGHEVSPAVIERMQRLAHNMRSKLNNE